MLLLKNITHNLRFILLLILFLQDSAAQDKYITPASFEWISRTSIDIMKSYRYYNTLINKYDPDFLLDANSVQTAVKNFTIPTSFGPITVGPLQLNMAIYVKWQVNKSFRLGFLAYANGIELIINKGQHPDLANPDGQYGYITSWINRKFIVAIRPDFNPDLKLTIGGLVKHTPYVTLSESGEEQFDITMSEKGYRTYVESGDLFLQSRYRSYELSTLYEFEENSLNLIEIKQYIEMGHKTGSLSIGYNRYEYLKTHQAGIEYSSQSFLSLMPFHIEAYWNIYKKGSWNDIGYILLQINREFLNDSISVNKDNHDFGIQVDIGTSYSKDLFIEGLFGFCLNVNLRNIWGIWRNLSIGFTYNYHDYLYRLPIKNEPMILVAFRIIV